MTKRSEALEDAIQELEDAAIMRNEWPRARTKARLMDARANLLRLFGNKRGVTGTVVHTALLMEYRSQRMTVVDIPEDSYEVGDRVLVVKEGDND